MTFKLHQSPIAEEKEFAMTVPHIPAFPAGSLAKPSLLLFLHWHPKPRLTSRNRAWRAGHVSRESQTSANWVTKQLAFPSVLSKAPLLARKALHLKDSIGCAPFPLSGAPIWPQRLTAGNSVSACREGNPSVSFFHYLPKGLYSCPFQSYLLLCPLPQTYILLCSFLPLLLDGVCQSTGAPQEKGPSIQPQFFLVMAITCLSSDYCAYESPF